MSLERKAWYIDHLGVERECIAVVANVFGVEKVMVVLNTDRVPISVPTGDLYYVPQAVEE